jgi:hypothetical protein
MKIYRCKEPLSLPAIGKDGKPVRDIQIKVGAAFTADDGQQNTVVLIGVLDRSITVSRQTLEKHFEELT